MSNSRGGERGLDALSSEVYSFQDSVKGELEDIKSSIKELQLEVRKQKICGTPQECSDVGTTGLEDAPLQVARPLEEVVAVMDPVWAKPADVVTAPVVQVPEASPEV